MKRRIFCSGNLTVLACATLLPVAMATLSGCTMGGGMGLDPADSSTATVALALHGRVHGGQQPITGSTLQVYAAGAPAQPTSGSPTGGYGAGATALIPAGAMTLGSSNNYYPGGVSGCTVTAGNTNNCTALPQTDGNGNFNITGDYTCTAGREMYMVATGGVTVPAASGSNQYIALMAALGACPTTGLDLSASIPYIDISEITTVGAVWALQNFMAAPDGTHGSSAYTSQGGTYSGGAAVNVGAPSGPVGGYGPNSVQTAIIGMNNAFRMVDNLVDFTQDGNLSNAARGVASGGAVLNYTWAMPYSGKIAAIANILADCVNSDPTSGSSTCSSLMTAAGTNLTVTPQDTLQAAYLMARNPTNNVTNLVAFATGAGAAFATSTTPVDFTVDVAFSPTTGTTTSTTTPGTAPTAVESAFTGAVDQYGHVWVLNSNNGGNGTGGVTALVPFVSELDANGQYLAGPFGDTAHGYPVSGGHTTSCVPTVNNHILNYSTSNAGPRGIAVDQNNNVWVANSEEATLTGTNCASVDRSVMLITGSGPTGAGAAISGGYWVYGAPYTLSIDAANNVWTATASSTSASTSRGAPEVFTNGTSTFTQGYTSPSTSPPTGTGGGVGGSLGELTQASAVDMKGNFWVVAQKGCYTGANTGVSSVLYQVPGANLTTPVPTVSNAYWQASPTGLCVNALSSSTSATYTTTTALATNVLSIATDANNGIWAAVDTGTSATSFVAYNAPQSTGWSTTNAGTIGTTGAADTPVGTTGIGGLNSPYGVAVDGANHAWFANYTGANVSELAVTLGTGGTISSFTSVPGSAFSFPTATPAIPLKNPKGIVVDPSGNVWVFSNNSGLLTNYVDVLVGAAAPVITPLTYQLEYSRVGQMPQ